MNRKNLLKLANYLEGDIKVEFNMGIYSDNDWTPSSNCGSIGCAIGHSPYAGIKKQILERWVKYSDRVFELPINEWKWCFHNSWIMADNTPIGAAKRIKWLLKYGLPDNWERQMEGLMPLCYNKKHNEHILKTYMPLEVFSK